MNKSFRNALNNGLNSDSSDLFIGLWVLLPRCATAWMFRKVGGTSAVWPLVPAVGAVRNAVAQLAHVDAEFGPSAPVLVGGAACHGALGT